jgi:hypothetical protein
VRGTQVAGHHGRVVYISGNARTSLVFEGAR